MKMDKPMTGEEQRIILKYANEVKDEMQNIIYGIRDEEDLEELTNYVEMAEQNLRKLERAVYKPVI